MRQKYGKVEVLAYGRHLLDYSAKMMGPRLRNSEASIAPKISWTTMASRRAQRIAVTIRIRGRKAKVDFTGARRNARAASTRSRYHAVAVFIMCFVACWTNSAATWADEAISVIAPRARL